MKSLELESANATGRLCQALARFGNPDHSPPCFGDAILSALPMQIAVLDAQGTIVWVNRAWTQFAAENDGEPERVGIGVNYLTTCKQAAGADAAAAVVQEGLEALLAGDLPEFSHEYSCHSPGRPRWFLLHAVPMNSSLGGIVVVHTNITERKLAEQKVQELLDILDQASETVVARTLDGRLLYLNKGFERMFGWPREEATGQNVREMVYSDKRQFDIATRLVLAQGEWHGEIRSKNRAGKELLIETHWSLIRDDHGQPKSVVVISTDVTEKRRLEQQFLRSQRLENVGVLASGIAHDLNNVLAPVLLCLPMLVSETSEEGRAEVARNIEASAQRAVGIVRQLLSFGRGQDDSQKIPLQPRHLLREMLRMVRETFPPTIEIKEFTAHDTWVVAGNATQLHQVMLNLAVNARDAMPQGGQLCFRLDNVTLDESYCAMNTEARPGPYVRLEVADTGTGIPDAVREKIFEAFFTTKQPGQGTGLGLTTVLGIVKNHGGFIEVASKPGQGTSFKVFFPAEPDQTAESDSEFNAPTPRGRGEMVLLVDDEAPVRDSIRTALLRHGYHVMTAADPVEGLALFAQHHREIQVVVTDMIMPLLDGEAFIRAAQRINRRIPFIVSTGLVTPKVETMRESLGVAEILAKPYRTDALLKILHRLLANPAHLGVQI